MDRRIWIAAWGSGASGARRAVGPLLGLTLVLTAGCSPVHAQVSLLEVGYGDGRTTGSNPPVGPGSASPRLQATASTGPFTWIADGAMLARATRFSLSKDTPSFQNFSYGGIPLVPLGNQIVSRSQGACFGIALMVVDWYRKVVLPSTFKKARLGDITLKRSAFSDPEQARLRAYSRIHRDRVAQNMAHFQNDLMLPFNRLAVRSGTETIDRIVSDIKDPVWGLSIIGYYRPGVAQHAFVAYAVRKGMARHVTTGGLVNAYRLDVYDSNLDAEAHDESGQGTYLMYLPDQDAWVFPEHFAGIYARRGLVNGAFQRELLAPRSGVIATAPLKSSAARGFRDVYNRLERWQAGMPTVYFGGNVR